SSRQALRSSVRTATSYPTALGMRGHLAPLQPAVRPPVLLLASLLLADDTGGVQRDDPRDQQREPGAAPEQREPRGAHLLAEDEDAESDRHHRQRRVDHRRAGRQRTGLEGVLDQEAAEDAGDDEAVGLPAHERPPAAL